MKKYSLMIHGGAGMVDNPELYRNSIANILKEGEKMLQNGASALDVVESCVSLLEDDPLFNAGRGSVLNENGSVDLDAAIMSGKDLAAGSVACVKNIKNPVKLARLVMEKTDHVMLIGEGAFQFAKNHNVEMMPDDYFIVEKRILQLKEAKEKNNVALDHSKINNDSKKFGTVGAVAMDVDGNLAAATSTGGIVNKKFGRVGDSPIIGAGVFADNETCAVSATGFGEQFIRTVLSKTISDFVLHEKMDAQSAAKAGIDYLVRKVEGFGGVIVIDKDGKCGSAFSTQLMIHGYVSAGNPIICNF